MGSTLPDLNSKRQIAAYHRTSTASARSQWALADLKSKRQSAVGTAGPQQKAPRSQWARIPDLNSKLQITVDLNRQLPPNRSERWRCRTLSEYTPDRRSEYMLDRMPEMHPILNATQNARVYASNDAR